MYCGDDDLSPPFISSCLLDGPYNSSLASSASSSSASVWSDTASHSSDDSSVTSASVTSDSEISESYCCTQQTSHSNEEAAAIAVYWSKQSSISSVAPEQRKHPRRTSCSNGLLAQSGCPPALIRQCDRKVSFVDSLVDCSAQIVEAIWPISSIPCRTDLGSKGVLPLRTFISETLKRSRTSYSTLQVALYYLVLIRPHVPNHDFTMEQTEDNHSFRALQCGRRMFLSALILASKYLQDRNYSPRAWSKISGLNTHEINQNEIAFLLAVNWRLHMTDDIFQRWSNIVLKYTPSTPPPPGSLYPQQHEAQAAEWKSVILGINPELDNIDSISPLPSTQAALRNLSRSSKPVVERSFSFGPGSAESTPTPSYYTPHIMEPSPSTSYSPDKAAPAYGLLPTPRLTPQTVGYRTPAASSSSYLKPSMAFALSSANQVQFADRWVTSSPQPLPSQRRSSLANSVSSASSPESMISDNSSRSSRSSSISSASSGMCAPGSKLDIQARCRSAQQYGEMIHRIAIATVPEHCFDNGPTSSPESYYHPVGKDMLETVSLPTSLPKYQCGDEVDAARTLQELQSSGSCDRVSRTSPIAKGYKRSRPQSIDQSTNMQDNVRNMLRSSATGWSENVVRQTPFSRATVNSVPRSVDGRKRVCCATEALNGLSGSAMLPRVGLWDITD